MLMSFVGTLDNLALKKSELVHRFEHLIDPKSDRELEAMAQMSRGLTLQNFGRTMRLFAPLYLSNECINNCRYCGFSRDNPILRVTLEIDEVVTEARHLARQGFRQILLVAGEHPKFVSGDYLAKCVQALQSDFSSISIEVAPMETDDYLPIVEAGAEGLVVYQETYNRAVYAEMHTAGPKRDFNFRLDCAERGYRAGFRRLGIGVLFGACDDFTQWRNGGCTRRENDSATGGTLPIAAKIHFGGAQWPRPTSTRMGGASIGRRRLRRICANGGWRLDATDDNRFAAGPQRARVCRRSVQHSRVVFTTTLIPSV